MTINFQETTDTAGIAFIPGLTFGAAWGNLNNDDFPDLYVGNHFNDASLYVNNGDGTFSDVAESIFPELSGDSHGAAWADFDNDGDQDIIQLVGAKEGLGSDPNRLYINDGGTFTEQASDFGIDYPLNRGRTPLWVDYDNDGLLDLVVGAVERADAPPTIFRQTANGFEEASATTGYQATRSRFSILADFSGDGNVDLVSAGVLSGSNSRVTIYDLTSTPFTDITSTRILPVSDNDFTSADFNGDLLPDLILTNSSF